MEDFIKSAKRLNAVHEEIINRQQQWKELKETIKNHLSIMGEKSGLEHEIQVTDHIENWESVSIKLQDKQFSIFIKGNKKQPIIKRGAYLVFGLLPSGYVKVGMVFPKIEDIKQKEISFLQFELIKDLDRVNNDLISGHFNQFLKEVIEWEQGEGGDLKERIGFKQG